MLSGAPAKPAMEWWCGGEQQLLPEEISRLVSVNSSDLAPAIALHGDACGVGPASVAEYSSPGAGPLEGALQNGTSSLITV